MYPFILNVRLKGLQTSKQCSMCRSITNIAHMYVLYANEIRIYFKQTTFTVQSIRRRITAFCYTHSHSLSLFSLISSYVACIGFGLSLLEHKRMNKVAKNEPRNERRHVPFRASQMCIAKLREVKKKGNLIYAPYIQYNFILEMLMLAGWLGPLSG